MLGAGKVTADRRLGTLSGLAIGSISLLDLANHPGSGPTLDVGPPSGTYTSASAHKDPSSARAMDAWPAQ